MILMASIFRTRDGLPLCANTDMDLQTKSLQDCHRYVKLLSRKLYSFPDRCSLTLEGYTIHFISALDQSFLTLVEESYPAVLAFCFLNEIQREFLSSYQHEKVQATQRPYTFMQFDPVLQKSKQRYNRPRNLTTRVNLSDMSHELKLRPPYMIQEDDLGVNNHSPRHPQSQASAHSVYSMGSSYHPVRRVGPVTWVGWLAVALNVFCGLLNFLRGTTIISHGHYDAEDSGAYQHGFTFLFSCCLIAFQIYLMFRPIRMRTTLAALTWLSVCFSIIYVAHFRNLLQILFHMGANTFMTSLIYLSTQQFKLPGYTV